MAASLDFEAPTDNSIDATSDRDFALEFLNCLSLLALHLSRWAEEMILFSSQEFGFVHLPEAYSTGSSAMPQKKNPDLLELVRGKSARILGNANTLMIAVKGLPLAYNKDLQETQEPLFDSAETVLAMMPLVSGFMKAVEFNYFNMQLAAESGFMNAWAAATYLVRRGVPFRIAHEQIGKAVQMCLDRGCELKDLPLEELRSLHPAFDEKFFDGLNLKAVLELHDVPGGTAPMRVQQAIAVAKQKVDRLREGVHVHA